MRSFAVAFVAVCGGCGGGGGGGGGGAQVLDGPANGDAPASGDAPRAGDAAAHDGAVADARPRPMCPAGSSLVVDRTSCGSAVIAPPETFFEITSPPGSVVSLLGFDEANVPCAPTVVCRAESAATLLFSDDPETTASEGVLYADTFGPGSARLYVYHVSTVGGRKFSVVALNQNATDAHVAITKEGLAPPSSDYVEVGKAVAAAWMSSGPVRTVLVPAGQRVVLDPDLDAEHPAANELVNAIIDVTTDMPVKFSVVDVLALEDAAAKTAALSLLPNDGAHDRGTFAGADLQIVGDAGGEGPSARHIRIGNGDTEPELTGTDATTGSAATLHGNYGVTYGFALTTPGAIGAGASARGGTWAGGLGDGTPLPTKAGGLATTTDAIWLHSGSAAGTARFSLMSAGGSSLPTDILVITP